MTSLNSSLCVLRKTVDETVRVTSENINVVAIWCEGSMHGEPDARYIVIPKAVNAWRTMAYVGYWIVAKDEGCFQILTDKEFNRDYRIIEG